MKGKWQVSKMFLVKLNRQPQFWKFQLYNTASSSIPISQSSRSNRKKTLLSQMPTYRWKEKENRENKTKQNWKFPPKRRLEEHNCLSSESKLCFEDEFSFPMTAFLPIYLFIYLKLRIKVPSTRLQFSVGLVWLFCSFPLHHCMIRYMTWSKLPKLSYNTISLS